MTLYVLYFCSTPSSLLPEWEPKPLYIPTKINLFELFHRECFLFTVSRDKLSELARPACCALSELCTYNTNCCEMRYTLACSCDKESPWISAYDIHKQIFMKLCLEPQAVSRTQVDGPKRQVHVKVTEAQILVDLLRRRTEVVVTQKHVRIRGSVYASQK